MSGEQRIAEQTMQGHGLPSEAWRKEQTCVVEIYSVCCSMVGGNKTDEHQ